MIAPKKITLTIDGKLCEGEAGQTILEIARTNGVVIPTLCYMKNLTPWGGCRLCIVEIEGSPKIVPSCTTPAQEGSKVNTKTDRLVGLRKATLELLFSERNHFCPMCQLNKGDCGLQHQGLAHGITGIRYPYLYPAMPVDVTAKYFGMDQNRCILCTRCVRTCDEQEGVHTLDVAKRGIKNQVVVDMNGTFGESTTCTQCGACVANCPTGTLFDKANAFRGQLVSCQQVLTTCTECSVGCGLKVFTKESRVVSVWGDPDSLVNKGHLCVKGRYQTWAEPRERIITPLIKGKPATWKEALAAIRKASDAAKKTERALLVAPRVTNETAQTIAKLAGKIGRIASYVGSNEAAFVAKPEYSANAMVKLPDADAIIIIGGQPSRDNGVVAATIRTTVRKRGAKLFIFLAPTTNLDQYANVSAPTPSQDESFWNDVAAKLAGVQRPAVVCGPDVTTADGKAVLARITKILADRSPLMVGVPVSANAMSLACSGIVPVENVGAWLAEKPVKFLHIVASDAPVGGARLLEDSAVAAQLKQAGCVVVQASYKSALTDAATVVLPAAIWCEKTGTVTNFEGRQLPVRSVLAVAGEAREDGTILESVFA